MYHKSLDKTRKQLNNDVVEDNDTLTLTKLRCKKLITKNKEKIKISD